MVELNHYYHDRGIKKYLGFYLSEHTHALERSVLKIMTLILLNR